MRALAALAAAGVALCPAPARAASPPWHLVVVGDSLARANACPGCDDFPTLYARAMAKATGRRVIVDNRAAVESSNVPAVQVTQLLADILTDSSLRTAIRRADVIVVDVGWNDLPWNRLDDPCDAAPGYPVVHWQKVTPSCSRRVASEYKRSLDEVLTEIDELRGCGEMPGVPPCSQRGAHDTLLRVVTVYNAALGDTVDPGWSSHAAVTPTVLGTTLFAHAQCEVAHFHGGRCADLVDALNGPGGNRRATRFLVPDHTHLSQRGHATVAAVLTKLGYSPLAP